MEKCHKYSDKKIILEIGCYTSINQSSYGLGLRRGTRTLFSTKPIQNLVTTHERDNSVKRKR